MKSKLSNAISICIILAMVVLSAGYTYFRVVKDTTFRVSERLSPSLVEYLNSSVDSSAIVNGIQVVRVNLKKNIRYIIHAHQSDPDLKDLYKNFSGDMITLEVPVFTDDFTQNARVIKLMNHQFDCVPHTDTLSYRFVPESSKYVTTVCSISIPPAFGDFKGLIAVTLNREPSDDDLASVSKLLVDLSDRVYAEISVAK